MDVLSAQPTGSIPLVCGGWAETKAAYRFLDNPAVEWPTINYSSNPMSYQIFHADCFDWLRDQPGNSIRGVLTDPPYGLIEFSRQELNKLRNGKGGGV